MKTYESALAALLLTASIAIPCAAQEAPSTHRALPSDTCAGCFAYLEFPPALEPESYAMRGDTAEPPASKPAAAEADKPLGKDTAGLLVTSKQKRAPAVSRPDHKQGSAP
jgi:hypothetical protein